MIKKFIYFLLFNTLNIIPISSFILNDDFLLYIIDNDIKNITKHKDLSNKKNKLNKNFLGYVFKFTQTPSKDNKEKKIKKLRNSTKKKQNNYYEKIIINDIIPYID